MVIRDYKISNNDKHEKHIINNRDKIPEKPNGFLRSLAKVWRKHSYIPWQGP